MLRATATAVTQRYGNFTERKWSREQGVEIGVKEEKHDKEQQDREREKKKEGYEEQYLSNTYFFRFITVSFVDQTQFNFFATAHAERPLCFDPWSRFVVIQSHSVNSDYSIVK